MKLGIVAFLVLALGGSLGAVANGDVAVWATATSKHATNGRVIVFRYAKEFRAGFNRADFPDRVILVWRYESASGMPGITERESMDRLEDALAQIVDKPGFSVLALVSTGEGLREWIFYARSEEAFLRALNDALARQPRLPIEVHAEPDSKWQTYERFRQGVRE